MSETESSDNCVNEIFKNKLFLGDVRIFNDTELLNKLELSHILTVELVPVPLTITSRFPNIAILQVNCRYNPISKSETLNDSFLSKYSSPK